MDVFFWEGNIHEVSAETANEFQVELAFISVEVDENCFGELRSIGVEKVFEWPFSRGTLLFH